MAYQIELERPDKVGEVPGSSPGWPTNKAKTQDTDYSPHQNPQSCTDTKTSHSLRQLIEGFILSYKLEFKPILNRPEGKYDLLCQYKQVSSQGENEVWAQTWLPFNVSKASKEGEVYVAPGELEFKFGIPKKDKVDIFSSKPK